MKQVMIIMERDISSIGIKTNGGVSEYIIKGKDGKVYGYELTNLRGDVMRCIAENGRHGWKHRIGWTFDAGQDLVPESEWDFKTVNEIRIKQEDAAQLGRFLHNMRYLIAIREDDHWLIVGNSRYDMEPLSCGYESFDGSIDNNEEYSMQFTCYYQPSRQCVYRGDIERHPDIECKEVEVRDVVRRRK